MKKGGMSCNSILTPKEAGPSSDHTGPTPPVITKGHPSVI